MTSCPVCRLPMRPHQAALAVAGHVGDGGHFAALVCTRCAANWQRAPEPARRRMVATVERRIGADPARYFVKACATAFDARLIVTLAADPKTAPEAVSLVLEAL